MVWHYSYFTVSFYSIEIPKKVFGAFDYVFHMMSGLQTNSKIFFSRWLFEIIHIIRFEMHMVRPDKSFVCFQLQIFCTTHLKTGNVDYLKRPSWKKLLYFFAIHSSSRHEKCCQMLQTLFWVFQYSRNTGWAYYLLDFFSIIWPQPGTKDFTSVPISRYEVLCSLWMLPQKYAFHLQPHT